MDIKKDYNYMLYGDSILKGVVYDESKCKYTVLEKSFGNILQDRLKGVVNNAARFGNTIIRGTSKLQNEVKKNNPDIVLIEFGGNDCDFNWEEVAENPSGDHVPKTDFNVFEKMLRSMIESLDKVNIVPVLLTLPPIDADRYFKWVSRNSAAMGSSILEWLGSVNKIYWWQERYNSIVLSLAQETRTRWIDIRSAFLRYPDYTRLICVDGIHPNEWGHTVIAEKILEYISSNYEFLLRESSV
jgi:lysophospholipase L1-like esterase